MMTFNIIKCATGICVSIIWQSYNWSNLIVVTQDFIAAVQLRGKDSRINSDWAQTRDLYALTRSFSHSSFGTGYDPSSSIAPYVVVMCVSPTVTA